ncbi:MAG: hypothetical protein ACK52L_24985, partial [Pirellula sp.]
FQAFLDVSIRGRSRERKMLKFLSNHPIAVSFNPRSLSRANDLLRISQTKARRCFNPRSLSRANDLLCR